MENQIAKSLKYNTILLVHMDVNFQQKFSTLVEEMGFVLIHVENIDQAYKIIGEQNVDIVILDAEEDYNAAFKFAYRIKHNKNLSRMLVVMLSAAEQRFGLMVRTKTKDEKKWLNVDMFINKPISPKSLYADLKSEIAILEGIDATELDEK
jgi:DNA-binding response OmpR family regulator